MKITLPKGWFARILLGGYVLLIVGTALVFAAGLNLITPLLVLSTFLVLGTVGYAGMFAIRRFWYYASRLRNGVTFTSTFRPVERILVAGWIVFVVAALGSLPLSSYKWVQTFGAEVLFFIFAIVLLASTLYGSYVLIRLAREHLGRR